MPVVVCPQPGLVAQAFGQAGMPRQHVTLQLRLPRNAREIAGQRGALVQPCLDGRDRIVAADQIIARDQHMGTALGRVVAGGGTVQLRECAPGFAGLCNVGQQRPRYGITVQILADANRMQLEGPFAMLDGAVAIGRWQHLHHRHARCGEMGDEAVFFFQAGRAAHAVVVALDEHRAVPAIDDGGGRQWPRAVPARLALLVQLRVALAQPRNVRRADRWPVGSNLVVVQALHAVGGRSHAAAPVGKVASKAAHSTPCTWPKQTGGSSTRPSVHRHGRCRAAYQPRWRPRSW